MNSHFYDHYISDTDSEDLEHQYALQLSLETEQKERHKDLAITAKLTEMLEQLKQQDKNATFLEIRKLLLQEHHGSEKIKNLKLKVLGSWFSKKMEATQEPINHVPLAMLKNEVLPLLKDQSAKYQAVISWLKNYPCTLEILEKEILPLLPMQPVESQDIEYVLLALISNTQNQITFDTLKSKAIILLQRDYGLRHTINIVAGWLKIYAPSVSPEMLRGEILPMFGRDTTIASHQNTIIKTWLGYQSDSLSFQELQEKSSIFFRDPKELSAVVIIWIKKHVEPPSMEQLRTILQTPPFNTTPHNENIAIAYFGKIENEDLKIQHFLNLAHAGLLGDIHECENMAELINNVGFSKHTIGHLCRSLHPNNEMLQVELLKYYLNELGDEADVARIIIDFASSLRGDDEVISLLQEHSSTLDSIAILDIANARSASVYASILHPLNQTKICDALTKDGLEKLRELFPMISLETINLSSLFSYYTITGGVSSLVRLIKPEVLRELRETFTPSCKTAHVSQQESQIIESIFAVKLPSMQLLCDRIKANRATIPPLPEGWTPETFEMNFTGSQRDEQEQQSINMAFRNLLHKTDITEDDPDVTKFFTLALKLEEGTVINETNQHILRDFVKANKNELVFLFGQEGEFERFAALVATLSDGCVGNLAAKVSTALTAKLINNPACRILFDFYEHVIARNILNTGDHLESIAKVTYTDILNNPEILHNSISPGGLATNMTEYFLGRDEFAAKAWKALDILLAGANQVETTARRRELLGILSDPAKGAAEIAAYLLIAKTIPELLTSPYIVDFTNRCQAVIGKLTFSVPAHPETKQREEKDREYNLPHQPFGHSDVLGVAPVQGPRSPRRQPPQERTFHGTGLIRTNEVMMEMGGIEEVEIHDLGASQSSPSHTPRRRWQDSVVSPQPRQAPDSSSQQPPSRCCVIL